MHQIFIVHRSKGTKVLTPVDGLAYLGRNPVKRGGTRGRGDSRGLVPGGGRTPGVSVVTASEEGRRSTKMWVRTGR